MNTKMLVQERISIFADGETSDEQLDIALAELRNAEGKATWELYHQIGDLMRSDEMATPLSACFAASMAQRLAAEPGPVPPGWSRSSERSFRSWGSTSSDQAATTPTTKRRGGCLRWLRLSTGGGRD